MHRHYTLPLSVIATFGLLSLATVASAADSLESLEERAFRLAAQSVAPSVVQIRTFGGAERVGKFVVGESATSGVAVTEDGYIVSSVFGFIQDPNSILVTFADGSRAAAKIVARDKSRNLVLIKANTEQKTVVPEFVDRDAMTVGEWAIAVGKTYDAKQPNISVGVLSAKNRVWGKAIQTDAKISPNNYGGPLVNIQGKVMGILAPLSPNGKGELAGAEWYDSGIGFAVPLSDLMARVDEWKTGKDLSPGLLGISLKGTNVNSDKAIIGAVRPNSPAYDAGWKAEDEIVDIDGLPITRQAQLKHALGPHYAGDTISVSVRRGEELLKSNVPLVATVPPYEHPFLGLLPIRKATEGAVEIRYVFPESPAALSGVKAGDKLTQIGEAPIDSVAATWQALAKFQPGDEVVVKFLQSGTAVAKNIKLSTLPTNISDEIPSALATAPAATEGEDAGEVVDIKIVEESNKCIAYVPKPIDTDQPYGLLIWLHAPEEFDKEKSVAAWKTVCQQNQMIVVMPQSKDPARWTRPELDYLRKVLDDVQTRYSVDSNRLAFGGVEAGGAMSYLFAAANPELVRGVVSVDAPLAGPFPPNDPLKRIAILSVLVPESKLTERITATIEKFQEMKYPVSELKLSDGQKRLSPSARSAVTRWQDSLDRI